MPRGTPSARGGTARSTAVDAGRALGPPHPLTGDERRARVALSFLAAPGDRVLGAALCTRTAAEVRVSNRPSPDLAGP